jgi:amino acid transporter
MKAKLSLLLMLFITIFPMNWLREKSAFLRDNFDLIFSPEWMHILGHLILFSVLVFLILRSLHLPLNPRTFIVLLGIILMIGGAQELLQLPTKGRDFSWPEVFDLGVDLLGGMMGVVYYGFYFRKQDSLNRRQHQTKDVTSERAE